MTRRLKIVVMGLSLSSSWGNGHATTYRALLRAMAQRGHAITFLERDQPWYAEHRDLPEPDFCRLHFYERFEDLSRFAEEIANSDATIVGSYVAEGVAIGSWVQALKPKVAAFYDIDTPVTLAKLKAGDFEYLSPELIPGYDLYLSFTGGPVLEELAAYGSPSARPLYCSVDADLYFPTAVGASYDLGYLGTYSADRQPALETFLIDAAHAAPALRFIVAGPQYPAHIAWPSNVTRVDHVPPAEHAAFYGSCRFVLNITRKDMVQAGFSPSVRLFEAAACGRPIISDVWSGIDTIFSPDKEILLARGTKDVLRWLHAEEGEARAVGEAARARALLEHSAPRRALELETVLAATLLGKESLQPKKQTAVLTEAGEFLLQKARGGA